MVAYEAIGELRPEDATRYKSFPARAKHLASDRPSIQFTCEEFSSNMSKPRIVDWDGLRRLGRHLQVKPGFVHRRWRTQSCRLAIAFMQIGQETGGVARARPAGVP